MNLAAWTGLDLELCGRLCLVLAHSLWQFALLAALATLVARAWKKATAEQVYAIYAGTLLLGLVALPATFLLTRLPGETLAIIDKVSIPRQELSQPSKAPAKQTHRQQAAPPYVAGAPPVVLAGLQPVKSPRPGLMLTWAPWLLGCYSVGVLMMLLRLARGLWANSRMSAEATPMTSGPLVETLQTLTRTWSLRVSPALAMTDRVIVPQVVGLWRPVILLPAAAISGLRPDELEMILAHELAHVRRYDLWMNLVQRLAEAVLFFNPALWYLSRRVSTYREYCCDEATCRLAHLPATDTRIRYAEALLRAVELTHESAHGQKLAALAAIGSGPSELRRRVARLFGEPLREPMRVTRSGLAMVLVGVALLVTIPLTHQNAAETKENAKQAESNKKPTVEVVAIGTHDEEPQRWWDADGKLLKDVPFTWSDADNVSSSERIWRRTVFRINDLPKDAKVIWQVEGGGSWGDATGTSKDAGDSATYFARYFGIPGNILPFFGKTAKEFGLRIGIAAGPWKVTEGSSKGMTATSRSGKGIVTSNTFPTDEGSVVIVSHNYKGVDFRVVAVDKQGRKHTTDAERAVGASDVGLAQWHFDKLKPEQIDRFEFQTREYEWTEIKDLPVEPKEPQAAAPAESKPTVEVVAIGTHDEEPQRWWDADGKLLKDVPFHVQGANVAGEARQLVYRIADLPKEADVTWSLIGCGSNANGEVVLDGKERPLGYFSSVFATREDSPMVQLRVGIAAGEWNTVTTAMGIGSQSMHLPDGKSIAFAKSLMEDDQFSRNKQAMAVVVTHNYRGMNVRLIAIDKSGKNHRSSSNSSHGIGSDALQTKYSFRNLLPSDIDRFEFQVRDYQWTEIKNLPVEPGENTDEVDTPESVLQVTSDTKYTLKVRPLLENLELAPSAYLTLWRETSSDEKIEPARQTWTDTQSQTVWIRERSAHGNDGRHGKEAREFHFTDLPAGRYCVTAASYQPRETVPDPTPFGISKAVLLGVGPGGDVPEPVDVVMTGNRFLTVQVLDSQTKEPIEGMAVRLFNSRGVPIVHGHGSGNFFERTSEAGEVQFRNLTRGEYRVDILGRYARVNEFIEYKPFVDSLRIQLDGPKPQTLTYNAPPHRLSDEEIAKRFPFSIHGRVTDEAGKPLPDVEVRAATGWGSLLGGGQVQTDAEGQFRLYFGPGLSMSRKHAPLGVGLQAALFFASKPGWYERDLHRSGDFLMSDSTREELLAQIEEQGQLWGRYSIEKVVFPNQPREVNFVLAPAATLRGKLVAEPGNDIEGQSVYLTGDELPPGSSVLKQFKSGEDGEFEIVDIPVRRQWRLGMRVGGTWQEVETEPFTLNEPGVHQCELTLSADKSDGHVAVKLTYREVKPMPR